MPTTKRASLVGVRATSSAQIAVRTSFEPQSGLSSILLAGEIWQALPREKAADVISDDFTGPPTPVFWSHVATVRSDVEAYVVLRSDSGEVKKISTGDLLPDGSRLLFIGVEELRVALPGIRLGLSEKELKGQGVSGRVVSIKTYINGVGVPTLENLRRK